MKQVVSAVCVVAGLSVYAPALAADPLIESLRRQQAIVGSHIVKTAEKVSEADYDFKATPEVRSLVDLFLHAASAQNYVCSQVDGQPGPRQEFLSTYAAAVKSGGGFKSIAGGKQKVVDTLRASFEYCDRVLAGLTPERAARLIAPGFLDRVMGPGEAPASALITVNIAHMFEHYGNMVTYLRLRGIVPPSSEK